MTTEVTLLRLIGAENYAEFDCRLAEYIGSLDERDPQVAKDLSDFLGSALLAARMKRAHYQCELNELAAERSFLGPRLKATTIDFLG